MRRLYESILDVDANIEDQSGIIQSRLYDLNSDSAFWSNYANLRPSTVARLNPDQHLLVDYNTDKKCLIFNKAKLPSFHLNRSISDLHKLIEFDFNIIQILGNNVATIGSTHVNPKTYGDMIISYGPELSFETLEELKDVKITVMSKVAKCSIHTIRYNAPIENVYIAFKAANTASVSYLANTKLNIRSFGELPNLSGITTNAECLDMYDCALFDMKESCDILAKIIDTDAPIPIYDSKLDIDTAKKFKINKLVAAVNNPKRYRFIGKQCQFKPGVKISDVFGLKNFTDLELIRISNNNVEFDFTNNKTRLKQLMPRIILNCKNLTMDDIPVSADGWYLIIRKL